MNTSSEQGAEDRDLTHRLRNLDEHLDAMFTAKLENPRRIEALQAELHRRTQRLDDKTVPILPEAQPEGETAFAVRRAVQLIETGEFAAAIDVCRQLMTAEGPDAIRARLTCACALAQLGKYAEADLLWPETVPDGESAETRLALAVARRMRGRFREALALLRADDADPRIRLELARLKIIVGEFKQARQLAEAVIREYDSPGHERHPRRLDAIGIYTEAEMALETTELRDGEESWDALDAHLRSVRDNLTGLLGAKAPPTLAASVRCARASVTRGRPVRALAEFADLEQPVRDVFGEDHPLHQWLRYSIAQAHAQLKRYDEVVVILRPLLARQRESIGPDHPDTMRTQLDLGIAYALIGDKAAAVPLIVEAERRVSDALGWRSELRNRAWVTRMLINMPVLLWQVVFPGAVDALGGRLVA